MNTFRTVINPSNFKIKISHTDLIMCIGSCFTENIGHFLTNSKFSTSINPFGIIYNPISICNTLNRILAKSLISESDLVEINDRFYHWEFHGDHSGANPIETIEKLNQQIQTAYSFLKQANYIFITLGTANAFQLVTDKRVVANCHKFPNDKFNRIELDSSEIIKDLQVVIDKLISLNPKLNLVFTISPVRHIRDGLVENQLSKAKLIQTAHFLSKANECVYYFPSYELIMDDLRDYRFYEEDMLHINKIGLEYIWNYFKQTFFTDKTNELISSLAKIQKDINHKPFYPESEKHQIFLNQLLKK